MVERDMRLDDIARPALAQYEIDPVGIQVIQQGGVKTVWKVFGGKGVYCLKRLKQTKDKALFSVEAQRYIKTKHGNVPGVVSNKFHESITDLNNELFVLYEWVEGKQLDFGKKDDFKAAMEGLADFHRFSKGYQPPEPARVSTKIAKWPDQYRSMLNRLSDWNDISHQKEGTAVYDVYREWAGPIIALGEKAIRYLEQSCYSSLSISGSPAVVLCHQDYGEGNAILTPEGVWVLDLDGVTYELAARDLRKIILKTMENQGKWNEEKMEEIVEWYEKINPLSADEKKMVYIDVLFPHSFFGTVKNQFVKNKPVKAANIERIGKIELSKEKFLKRLIEEI